MKRIKRALFELFRDEILNFVGHHKHVEEVIRVEQNLIFTEINSEILIRADSGVYGMPIENIYEQSLQRAKEKIFKEAINFIQIDGKSVLKDFPMEGRIIKLSLYVGKKQ